MPNVTISLDEELIKAGRRYAEIHHTSMNALLRNLLEKTVKMHTTDRLTECFELMDRAGGNSKGQAWKRQGLYDE
jgi:plasmid stability protein